MWEYLAGGALGALGSIFNNERNMRYQREAMDYMKQQQQVMYQREDSAVQRRVADLKAAGLSPVLAAGSAAASSAPVKIDPVQANDSLGIAGALQGMSAVNQYAQTASSLATAESQREVFSTQADLNKIKAGVLSKEFDLYNLPAGHPKYGDVWGKRISEALQALKSTMPAVKGVTAEAKRRADKNWDDAGKTPAERAKQSGRWHLFNQF